MAIPILKFWQKYFNDSDEGLGSTYERFIINEVLFKAVFHYRIKSVLETPSFGFTGLSGINSMGLALSGIDVTITDSDKTRLNLIKQTWENFNVKALFDNVNNYNKLPYDNKSFDMSWNFSALWFVPDLHLFLNELSRVTKKIILIIVPNRSGLGYLHQKYTGHDDLKKILNEENIKPKNFIPILESNGWKLMHDALIDCPLWPDIGMSKEELLNLYFSPFIKTIKKNKNPITILDYYSDKDKNIKDKVMKFDYFERYAPEIFKRIWAHHHYYLFLNR